MEPRNWFEPQFLELVFGHHQTSRSGIVLLAGIACRHHGTGHFGFERAELAKTLDRGIGAVAFVVSEDDGVALLLRDCHRDQFIVELALRPGGGGALVAARGIGIAGLAADVPVLGEVFGGFDHAADHPEAFDRLAHHPAPSQAIMQRQVAGAHALANVGRVMLDVRHAFAAARDDHVAHPGLDHHRSVDDRLQA